MWSAQAQPRNCPSGKTAYRRRRSEAQRSLKPKTAYSVETRLWNTADWSDWGPYSGNSCQTLVSPVPPAPSIPASSPQCTPYFGNGKVIDALNVDMNGQGTLARVTNGYNAVSGVWLGGTGYDVVCMFYRKDEIYSPPRAMYIPFTSKARVAPIAKASAGV